MPQQQEDGLDPSDPRRGPPYKCKFCNKTFTHAPAHVQHERAHVQQLHSPDPQSRIYTSPEGRSLLEQPPPTPPIGWIREVKQRKDSSRKDIVYRMRGEVGEGGKPVILRSASEAVRWLSTTGEARLTIDDFDFVVRRGDRITHDPSGGAMPDYSDDDLPDDAGMELDESMHAEEVGEPMVEEPKVETAVPEKKESHAAGKKKESVKEEAKEAAPTPPPTAPPPAQKSKKSPAQHAHMSPHKKPKKVWTEAASSLAVDVKVEDPPPPPPPPAKEGGGGGKKEKAAAAAAAADVTPVPERGRRERKQTEFYNPEKVEDLTPYHQAKSEFDSPAPPVPPSPKPSSHSKANAAGAHAKHKGEGAGGQSGGKKRVSGGHTAAHLVDHTLAVPSPPPSSVQPPPPELQACAACARQGGGEEESLVQCVLLGHVLVDSDGNPPKPCKKCRWRHASVLVCIRKHHQPFLSPPSLLSPPAHGPGSAAHTPRSPSLQPSGGKSKGAPVDGEELAPCITCAGYNRGLAHCFAQGHVHVTKEGLRPSSCAACKQRNKGALHCYRRGHMRGLRAATAEDIATLAQQAPAAGGQELLESVGGAGKSEGGAGRRESAGARAERQERGWGWEREEKPTPPPRSTHAAQAAAAAAAAAAQGTGGAVEVGTGAEQREGAGATLRGGEKKRGRGAIERGERGGDGEEEGRGGALPAALWCERALLHRERTSEPALRKHGHWIGEPGIGGAERGRKLQCRELVECAVEGDDDGLQQLIHAGTDINFRDAQLHTPLHIAAAVGNVGAVELLLEAQGDVRARGQEGDEPLHVAASQGHYKVVETLLARGGNLDAVNNERLTARHLVNLLAVQISTHSDGAAE